MKQTVLILGANGRFGRHTADAFWNAGWNVRRFDRATDDLMAVAKDVDVIVNAWNPAYPDWASTVPDLTRQVIAAAEASDAAVLLPGNVYVFGPTTPGPWSDRSDHSAKNTLGRIRIRMEAAYRASSAQVIVLRGGDFLDTEASGNWFDAVIAAKAKKGTITSPGDPDAAHAWAYLPDMASAAMGLAAARHELPRFADIAFPGYTLSIRELARLAEKAAGRPMRVRRMAWLPIYAAVPVWKVARHLLEMRYLWSLPHRLDGTRLDQYLPTFRATDPAVAMASVLQDQIKPDQSVTAGQLNVAAE